MRRYSMELKELKESIGQEKFNKIQNLINECLKEGVEVEITIPKSKLKRLDEGLFKDKVSLNATNDLWNFLDKNGIDLNAIGQSLADMLTPVEKTLKQKFLFDFYTTSKILNTKYDLNVSDKNKKLNKVPKFNNVSLLFLNYCHLQQ